MNLFLTIPLLSFFAAIALLIAALIGRGEKTAFPVAITGVIGSLVLAIYFSFLPQHIELLWFEPVMVSFQIDGLASAMQITSCLIALAVITVANHNLDKKDRARSFGFILLLLSAALTASMTSSLLVLLISWEFMALSIWQLAAYLWENKRVTSDGAKAFLILRIGDLGLYAATAAAFASAGCFEIETVAQNSGPWLHFIAAGLVLSAMVKSAQIPFSVWMGTAMKSQPHISGTLVGALLAVSGGYLLVRSFAILETLSWTLPLIAWAGGITALSMACVALVQSDLRQVLAASSASQKGFIFMAIGLGALPAAVAFIISHAVYKGLLFIGTSKFHSISDDSSLSGLKQTISHQLSKTHIAFVPIFFIIALLALSGIPPLSGWIIKDKALSAAFMDNTALYILGTVAGFMTSLYAGRLFWIIFQNQIKAAWPNRSDFVKPVFWAMIVLTLFLLSTSAFISPDIANWWSTVIIGSPGYGLIIWIAIITGILAFLGLGIVRHWQLKERLEPFSVAYLPHGMIRSFRQWFGLYSLFDIFITSIFALCKKLAYFDTYILDRTINNLASSRYSVKNLSAKLAYFDTYVWDKFVDSTASFTLLLSERTAKEGEKSIDLSVNSLSGLIARIGRWARLPQNGLLHNYYAQAVVIISVFIFFILWLI